ncbi:MAG: hypothetical protein XE10_0607 [Methanoculleus marisnigri]|jgi:hypothetical protein|uniref:2TM domain-containing protein n=1 Tax=Methanoculleus marisnigri TaxID=2198 RepID=A0A101GPY3_9EURY|nr:MAG: hypothetical protein XD82_0679 [Methanoculleus marisnigri]KUL02754.1 MAG: hypothetical protein XE10_0607 [Methanoculleus marisnigri]
MPVRRGGSRRSGGSTCTLRSTSPSPLLFAINIVSSPGTLWFYWVTTFGEVGVVFHALQIFGREWEEKKIREVMVREERR